VQYEICKEGEQRIFGHSRKQIGLVALDLDRTTLDSNGRLTDRTKNAIEAAIKKGTPVIVATGRALSALPEDIFTIEGLRYIVTANGASAKDLLEDRSIYSNCIDPRALEKIVELLSQYDFMYEFFVKGEAYVEKAIFDRVEAMNFTERHITYIKTTRKPVDGLFDLALTHKESVENINVNFENQDDRSMMREVLAKLEHVTLTTSFDHNLELGGETTSKAEAVRMLCDRLGISEENVMACGDSPNDLAMLLAAGFPVAMGNAKDELKAAAKYITSTNDEDGVAEAIEKFVLGA